MSITEGSALRISELSRRSGVAVPTLKFYLREGLIPRGDPRARNQADYGDEHVRRLRLIGALTDVGGLSLRQVREILSAIDDPAISDHELLGRAQYALEPEQDDVDADILDEVDRSIKDAGWDVHPDAPARATLASTIASLRALGWTVGTDQLRRYAAAVDGLARAEVRSLPETGARADMVERSVVGTVLFGRVLTALRRLAHEHHSARRFARPSDSTGRCPTARRAAGRRRRPAA